MPATTLQNLIDRFAFIAQDPSNIRWTVPELTDWANDAQREVVLFKPDACTKNESVALVAGTKQSIPAAGVRFIDMRRNMGANGSTPGRVIRQVAMSILDAEHPDWHSMTASAAVQHFAFDIRDPKTFYVYPPQPATGMGYVEIIYSQLPAALAATTDSIGIDDIYANILVDYMLYRAYSKDTDYAGNVQRATAHYQAFATALGVKTKIDLAVAPKPEVDAGPSPAPQAIMPGGQ